MLLGGCRHRGVSVIPPWEPTLSGYADPIGVAGPVGLHDRPGGELIKSGMGRPGSRSLFVRFLGRHLPGAGLCPGHSRTGFLAQRDFPQTAPGPGGFLFPPPPVHLRELRTPTRAPRRTGLVGAYLMPAGLQDGRHRRAMFLTGQASHSPHRRASVLQAIGVGDLLPRCGWWGRWFPGGLIPWPLVPYLLYRAFPSGGCKKTPDVRPLCRHRTGRPWAPLSRNEMAHLLGGPSSWILFLWLTPAWHADRLRLGGPPGAGHPHPHRGAHLVRDTSRTGVPPEDVIPLVTVLRPFSRLPRIPHRERGITDFWLDQWTPAVHDQWRGASHVRRS